MFDNWEQVVCQTVLSTHVSLWVFLYGRARAEFDKCCLLFLLTFWIVPSSSEPARLD